MTNEDGVTAIALTEPGRSGALVRMMRKERGLSRQEVARAAGFTARELSAAERGRRTLTANDWRSLAGSLGVDVVSLAPSTIADELERPETHAQQIDAVLDNDESSSEPFPFGVADLAAPLPVDMPSSERRRDRRMRHRVERTWGVVADDMDPVVIAARRLVMAISSDDPVQLVEDLEQALTELRSRRSFRRHAARHRRIVQRARRRTSAVVQSDVEHEAQMEPSSQV